MTKYPKKNTPAERQERVRIENALNAITPLSEMGRRLLSPEGFIELFFEMRYLYPTYNDAYERLEQTHEAVFGHRRYCEYRSFMESTKYIRKRH